MSSLFFTGLSQENKSYNENCISRKNKRASLELPPQELHSSNKNVLLKNSKAVVITKAGTNKVQIFEDIKMYLIKFLHPAKWAIYSLALPQCSSAWKRM